jgi:hypothetical protein
MGLLVELKVEESDRVVAAAAARKKALAQLRRLTGRRAGVATELATQLEEDGEGSIAQELRGLEDERAVVAQEISELEEKLVGLRNRKRWLDARVDDARNRRDAGLSGYRGALKELDAKVDSILRRPPVRPLDLEAVGAAAAGRNDDGVGEQNGEADQSPGGVEFLSMRPERRTAQMATDWWESEITILDQRRDQIGKERGALEEGAEIWKEVVGLVTDFETGLRRELNGDAEVDGKGKRQAPSPEEAMHAQLEKMKLVMSGLEERLRFVEDRGWNLLICAVGAELEAFKQAYQMLREALGITSPAIRDDGLTPPLGRSMSGRASPLKPSGSYHSDKRLVEVDEGKPSEEERDENDIPRDLLVSAQEDMSDKKPPAIRPSLDREDSENEVPPEFLAEHQGDDDSHGLWS